LVRLRETSAETGVGLAGMRERLHELNGKLEIESEGHGTTMRATVPVPHTTRVAQQDRGVAESSARPPLDQKFDDTLSVAGSD
jgi:signal transduction histidine kinase